MENGDEKMSQTALITGATGAIGYAIAGQLAADTTMTVVLAARNADKAQAAVARIREHTGNVQVSSVLVDVSDKASIAALAALTVIVCF